MITKEQIKKIIPYNEPFLFVDRIIKLNKKGIVAEKKLKRDYDFFKGHFVKFPLMPGTLTLEAIGQAATFLIRHNIKNNSDKDILLYAVNSAEFFAPLFPDDTVTIKVKILKIKGKEFDCRGEVLKNNHVVCKGSLSLVAVDRNKFREKCSKRTE
jgi:3-hydroxyacyl-[acyl-carrier-protein] dehydratase